MDAHCSGTDVGETDTDRLRTVAQTLLGSFVMFLTVPTEITPVTGGWRTSRGTQRQRRRTVVSSGASMLWALPWMVVTFLAMRDAIEPMVYHDGIVHVGVLTASPSAFVLWQEPGLSIVLIITVAAFAVAGGFITDLLGGGVWSRRGKTSQ